MWSNGGLSLSDLAANHFEKTSNTSVLSFFDNAFKEDVVMADTSREPVADRFVTKNSIPPQRKDSKDRVHMDNCFKFSDFDSFFEDNQLLSKGEGLEKNQADNSASCAPAPSSFGCMIMGQVVIREKKHFAAAFSSHKDLQFSVQDRQRKPEKSNIFITGRTQSGCIKPFDFLEPSPDDIIIAKQKMVL